MHLGNSWYCRRASAAVRDISTEDALLENLSIITNSLSDRGYTVDPVTTSPIGFSAIRESSFSRYHGRETVDSSVALGIRNPSARGMQ